MPGFAPSRHILRAALLLGVPLGGFLLGRLLSPGAKQREEKPEPAAAAVSPRDDGTQRLLCEIANGNLASARTKVAALKDTPDSNELVSLLTAIALKDGKSFDALVAGFEEPDRTGLIGRCMLELANTPAGFFQALDESQELSRVARGPKIDKLVAIVGQEPDLFLDLLEEGRCAWSSGLFERILRGYQPGPERRLRLLELCGKGAVKIADSNTLEGLMLGLPEDAFAKLQADFASSPLADALRQEASNRAFFAELPADPERWRQIDKDPLFSGMEQMIESSGMPVVPWAAVPADLRPELAGRMLLSGVNAQGDAGVRTMLDSIMKSALPEEERNQLLADSATKLFEQHGNIRLAIDFAHGITSDAEGHNVGEDLLVKWTAYDPISAKVYIDKSQPSAYRDRLISRVKELTP